MNRAHAHTPSHAALPDPYCVRSGDTLSKIARKCGRSTADLQRINAIKHADRLEAGQTLYLSEASAFGASVLFLDALRHPIQNLRYRVEFDGHVRQGTTGPDGLVPKFITNSASSHIKVWVQAVDGIWQQTAHMPSDLGHKLVTLTSSAVVIASKTREIARDAAHDLYSALEASLERMTSPQPPAPAPTSGTAGKNNPAVKGKATKGPKGQPVVKLEVDIPQGLLDLFAQYDGRSITEDDWRAAAKNLGCEPAVLKAFAEVESGGRSSFWRLNKGDGASIPALLFERHYFSRATQGRFDEAHPDISWPAPYRKKSQLGQNDKHMHDGRVDADDVYSDFASAYLRLINAYRLDADAALRACSWGKFQIMGDNHVLCGYGSVVEFCEQMCRSEKAQIELIVSFIRKKPAPWKDPKCHKAGKLSSLWEAINAKDWPMIAFNYNGAGYKTYNYDTKLKAAYEMHMAQKI